MSYKQERAFAIGYTAGLDCAKYGPYFGGTLAQEACWSRLAIERRHDWYAFLAYYSTDFTRGFMQGVRG